VASSAPPSPFEPASGFSSSDLTPVAEAPEVPLVEFASPSEPNRVSAARASGLATVACAHAACRSKLGIVSRGVLAPASTIYVGCPVRTHPGREAGAGRVEVAKPPPEPSSGFLPLSTVLAAHAARTNPLRSPSFAVAPRRFAALFHAARAPGVALQSFPFSRSRTRSRGPCASLWVRVRPPNGAARSEVFAAPFADRADLSPRLARRLAGLEGRDVGSLESLAAARHPSPGSSATSRLGSAGLAGLGGRHAHFEAFLPSRVRSRDDRSLARARSSGRCSPGLDSSLERPPSAPWVRSARRRTRSGRTRASCAAKASHLATRIRQVPALAVGSRTHGPPTCPADRAVHVHRQAATLLASAFAKHPHAGRQPRRRPRESLSAPPPTSSTRRVARAPSRRRPAPPSPSSVHHREGVPGWTSETP